ncbi:BMP family ABC transporter substrate-binding protein [Paenibacillus pectinilyticus]|uniref:BMP family ABC transporter substrate-binding protein n=1 Tax=Paenibacillus pectinilyticus TaxID=512399 RepID=A0A1C1A2I1_9BACL|nr:BMP family ABC transporter substrate-binding protein [Paenibacillus pectinilyticus]OCT14739.1 BMP family ABC transporter substrate-binding protein [Paenibacillus pectinilyticus]
MAKKLKFIAAMTLLTSILISGCGSTEKDTASESTSKAGKPLKVALLIPGNVGDKSFLDSAANGLTKMKDMLGAETKVVEMGMDQTKWEPTMSDISEQNYDVIVTGPWQVEEVLAEVAPRYPKKKYILFDSELDYASGKFGNVASLLYKQNEASFLAGALAAKVTNSDMPLATKSNVIGFVGGMDIPVINDFLVSYIQGAKYVNPNIKVAVSYIGDFVDSAKGKEMALAQYNEKADVIYNVASQAGLGVLEGAKAKKKYVIGTDTDQAEIFKSTDPEKSELILTSILKQIDNSLLLAVKDMDHIKWGAAQSYGLKEGSVGMALNEFFKKNVPEGIRNELAAIQKKIESGEIKVDTGLGMSTDEIDKIKASVRP